MTVVHVLGNPAARGGTGDTEAVVAAVRGAGRDVVVLDAGSPAESSAAAAQAVADGAERLVVVGGDGLVRLAVGAVATTSTVLGIVPQGTGNDFARALGLLDPEMSSADAPQEHQPTKFPWGRGARRLRAHVERALAEPVPVDAMRTDHGWVASVATIGFSGDVTARANALRWPKGQQRYTVATLLQLPRLRHLQLTVEVDGVVHDAATSMLSIGNTAFFGGGMAICPDAGPADGLLQVVVIGAVGRLTFGRVFPRVFTGSHVAHPDVTSYRATRVVVSGADDEMWADGDPLGPLPVTCEAVAGALQVAGAVT